MHLLPSYVNSSFLDALPGPAAILDRAGRILAVNERWRAFGSDNGLSDPRACVGANYLAVCERADGDCGIEAREAARGIGAVLAGVQDCFVLEYTCHSPREDRWFLMTASTADLGTSSGGIILHLDISAGKANQRAQQFLDDYFNTPFQEAAIGLAVIDPLGRFIQLNDTFCKMLGYTEAELKRKSMISVTHPDDKGPNQLLLSQLTNGERNGFVMEKRYLTKQGETIWVRISVSARRNAFGQVTSVLAFAEDISKQKSAFRELEDAKARLEMAGQLSRLGAWELQAKSKSVILSEQARLIYDMKPEPQPELEDVLSLHTQADRPKLAAAIEACLDCGTPYDLELEVQTAGRQHAWVRTIGQAIRQDGRITLIRGAVQDVTERVSLQRKASHAQKMEAIGQLTGGVAHDFNNLLTIVIGNAELLEEQLVEHGDLLSLAQSTRSAAERGAKLVEHLLAFARRQSLRPKPIDVTLLVIGMATLLRRTLGPKTSIAFSIEPDIWQVLADAAQLESAVLNLCLNARDAMPDGGTITIDVRNHTCSTEGCEPPASLPPGQYVSIGIIDSGTGMSPEVIARACEPFFTTKEAGGGSGLGLSMVSGFIQQSKGEIKIESELGSGTTVRIFLPCASAQIISPPPGPRSINGQGSILLVDDEPDIRRYSRRQLEDLGYTVAVCENGDEALELLRSGAHFDLLLTDMVMPGTFDGIGLAQRARELNSSLKILLSTGYSDQVLAEITEHGFSVLKKPYRKSDLALTVRQALAA